MEGHAMGPIGWPEIILVIFWIALIAGVVWLYRRIDGISEDVAAIRRALEERPPTDDHGRTVPRSVEDVPTTTPPTEPPRG
jgi:hypothetical protein